MQRECRGKRSQCRTIPAHLQHEPFHIFSAVGDDGLSRLRAPREGNAANGGVRCEIGAEVGRIRIEASIIGRTEKGKITGREDSFGGIADTSKQTRNHEVANARMRRRLHDARITVEQRP